MAPTSTSVCLDAEHARDIARIMQALATPSRLLILSRLRAGPCRVGTLADAVGMEHSAVSHQLRNLHRLGLVSRDQHGRTALYRLHNDHIAALLDQAVHHIRHRQRAHADRDPWSEP